MASTYTLRPESIPACPECFPGKYFPAKCACGGLIHSHFTGESFDVEGDGEHFETEELCDSCGKREMGSL